MTVEETFGGVWVAHGGLAALLTENGSSAVVFSQVDAGSNEEWARLKDELRRCGLSTDAVCLDDYPATDDEELADPDTWVTIFGLPDSGARPIPARYRAASARFSI